MPLRPPTDGPTDPRLDAYRDRAGTLLDAAGEPVGTVYIRILRYWTARGPLWRRRFSNPRELAEGRMVMTDGRFDDFLVHSSEQMELEIADWSLGIFQYRGEQLRVTWLDDAGSQRMRRGVVGPDKA